MANVRNAAGVPTTYRGFLWSKIIDAMVGSSVAANGDILRRNAGFWERHAISTNGKLLKVVSGLPTWSATGAGGGIGLAAALYQSTDLVITNATTGSTYVDTELLTGLVTGTYRFEIQAFQICHATPKSKTRLHFTGTVANARYLYTTIIESDANYYNSIPAALDTDMLFSSTAVCL